MRVGVIGAGAMGAVHAAAWRALAAREPELEFVGVASRDPAGAAALATAHHARGFRDPAELLAAVEVIDLCTPTHLHAEHALQAAAAGVHVIVEKPLARTLAEADAVIAACAEAGVRLFVAMVVRFFPQYRAVAEALAAGRIGAPGVLRLRRVAYPPGEPDSWFRDEARSGGMPLDLMIHDLDAARWWGGEVVRVYARSRRSSHRGASAPAAGDYALATLRHEGGAMSLVEGGWAYPPGTFRTAFDVAGSEGLVEWDSDASAAVVRRLAPRPGDAAARVGLPLAVFAEDPYEAELAHAYRAIRDRTPFAVDAADARAALRLALAVKRSLAERRPVDPAELG